MSELFILACMNRTDLPIHGAQLITLKRFDDDRGSFAEAFRASWLDQPRPWVQWNVSRSQAGVLRGLHVHRRQTDYWHLVSGNALAALVDIRPDSPSYRQGICVPLQSQTPQTLVIPTGVLHGFYAQSDVILMYLLDQEYDPTDELGVRWNDPELNLPASWYELPAPTLSPRDAQACPLCDLRF